MNKLDRRLSSNQKSLEIWKVWKNWEICIRFRTFSTILNTLNKLDTRLSSNQKSLEIWIVWKKFGNIEKFAYDSEFLVRFLTLWTNLIQDWDPIKKVWKFEKLKKFGKLRKRNKWEKFGKLKNFGHTWDILQSHYHSTTTTFI